VLSRMEFHNSFQNIFKLYESNISKYESKKNEETIKHNYDSMNFRHLEFTTISKYLQNCTLYL